MMTSRDPWNVYRTRFLVRARQLTEPLLFTDSLGREHSGQPGDYLVEFSDGILRITTQALFEDIYVPFATPPATAPAITITIGDLSSTSALNGSATSIMSRPAVSVLTRTVTAGEDQLRASA
jgi:hypothetical protein